PQDDVTGEMPTGEDAHGSDYFTPVFLLPQLCNNTATKSITAELKDDPNTTTPVNHKRVARMMSSMKLFGFTKKRKVITTIPAAVKPVFPDLVKRHFNALAANEVYVGDIAYLPIADGSNMYLATVIDCYSRRLVGFAIADHMRTSLVQDALLMVKGQRGSLKEGCCG
ncbi:hypothetical protein AUO95_15575, partial [Corynebacterium glutamicum]